ncbi:IclR family transcriptional regulator [Xenophilus azovorans]|uniref:IclR family transcriptional regulator n=1 Tax=Xenophilus azovorans TaxID=151755 RepID=UPI00056F89AE|nr:IclR family transcriptional regulator [Xenophilus azovorans]
MTEKTSSQPLVTGLLRGLAVLRCFDYGRERLGSSDIARMTGLPQPTVWRLCKTLEHGGYLVADKDGGSFRPGLSILTLGFAALDTLELTELVRPLLQEIANTYQAACSLSVKESSNMLYLQRMEAPRAILSLNLRVGSEVPIINSGTGWALLAGMAAPDREETLAQCRKADAALYKKMHAKALAAVDDYAQNGFVSNVDVFFPGLSTVSVPLRDNSRWTPYALNCTAATSTLGSATARKAAGMALRRAVEQVLPIVTRIGQ